MANQAVEAIAESYAPQPLVNVFAETKEMKVGVVSGMPRSTVSGAAEEIEEYAGFLRQNIAERKFDSIAIKSREIAYLAKQIEAWAVRHGGVKADDVKRLKEISDGFSESAEANRSVQTSLMLIYKSLKKIEAARRDWNPGEIVKEARYAKTMADNILEVMGANG